MSRATKRLVSDAWPPASVGRSCPEAGLISDGHRRTIGCCRGNKVHSNCYDSSTENACYITYCLFALEHLGERYLLD